MVLPVIGYGHPVLRQETSDITPDYPNLAELIEDMWDTMYGAKGVGLAAPQIGLPIRLFVVDTEQVFDEEDEADLKKGICKVFINAEILEEDGEFWPYEEGCLSIPEVRAKVDRPETIIIRYQDEHFNTFTEKYDGVNARVIQHEYDHIEGILFTDLLKPLKKKLLKRKLNKIKGGEVRPDYPIKFYLTKSGL